MDTFVALSQSYSGRDKLMRTAGYLSVLLTGACNPQGKIARDLLVFSKHLAAGRTMMRFFDDLPMWTVTRKSLFSKDKDAINKLLSVIGNLSIQAYFPIEKIAWAADNEIIPIKGTNWWTAGIVSWAIFLTTNILKNIRNVANIRNEQRNLIKKRKLESPGISSDSEIAFKRNLAELKQKEFFEYVNLLKNIGDLVMAVNWLPQGFLWAAKLSPSKNAFFGCISSFLGVFLLIVQQRQTKKD